MARIKIIFDDDLRLKLLHGARVVWFRSAQNTATVLIRLPKGSFHLEKSALTGEPVAFEFIEYNQDRDEKETYHAVSRNGSLAEVKKKVSESHYSREAQLRRIKAIREKHPDST